MNSGVLFCLSMLLVNISTFRLGMKPFFIQASKNFNEKIDSYPSEDKVFRVFSFLDSGGSQNLDTDSNERNTAEYPCMDDIRVFSYLNVKRKSFPSAKRQSDCKNIVFQMRYFPVLPRRRRKDYFHSQVLQAHPVDIHYQTLISALEI